jgi:hypothetical protein
VFRVAVGPPPFFPKLIGKYRDVTIVASFLGLRY